jgi:hypothetical protein
MSYERLIVGVVLGVTAFASPVAAQETRKLSIGVNARVEHDSNVAKSSASQAALRGLSRADTLFTPAATIEFLQPVGRHSVFFNGSAGYSFYEKNDQLNRERLDFNGGGNAQLGPCRTTLLAGYSRGINQVDDPLLEVSVENIQEVKRVNAEITCSRSTGLGVVGRVSQDWVSNNFDILNESDYETTSAMAGVTYSRPALGTLTVFGSFQKTDYPDRLIASGYEMTSYGLTYDRQLGARIQGSVTVAFANVEQLGLAATDGDLQSTTYSGLISYRASNRLSLQASFDRAVSPSVGIGRTYDLSTTYRLAGDYRLGSRITLSAGVAQVDRDSEGLLFPGVSLTDSVTKTFFGSVRYRQSERLSFMLDATREERTTNAPQFDYTSNRVGVTTEVAF